MKKEGDLPLSSNQMRVYIKEENFMPKVTQSIKETTVNTEGEIIQESQKLTYSWEMNLHL